MIFIKILYPKLVLPRDEQDKTFNNFHPPYYIGNINSID